MQPAIVNNRNRVADFVRSLLLRGKEPQSFIGAKWLVFFLSICPHKHKRTLALIMLDQSPHYFYKYQHYKCLSYRKYLEAEYQRNYSSRRLIFDTIIRNYVNPGSMVIDYGCGPGFLARYVSEKVKHIYALDISLGALACARVINQRRNLEYLIISGKSLSRIPDASIDIVYSIAVAQHVTNEALMSIAGSCFRKLKEKGILLMHVQLEDSKWAGEEDWRKDKSLKGRQIGRAHV